jgi:hypothetical protein
VSCETCGLSLTVSTSYVSRRGKKFCDSGCADIYVMLHPWTGNTNNNPGRKGRWYNVR